ncbi:MAG: isoprenylcysteine carboxylmethyltransferase family protein [Candidatus Acidiferrales bacterium]
MTFQLDYPAALAVAGVMLAWLGFAAIFAVRNRTPSAPERKRDAMSRLGIGIQMVAYACVWFFHRNPLGPIVPMARWLEWIVAALSVGIAAVSVWFVLVSVRTLGKQWAYVARVVEGHQLIVNGPYRVVRNPIYLGMFGMLVATGLALTQWPVLLACVGIFVAGTVIRIRREEKLLREAFGAQFEDYARRVPALFPGLY